MAHPRLKIIIYLGGVPSPWSRSAAVLRAHRGKVSAQREQAFRQAVNRVEKSGRREVK